MNKKFYNFRHKILSGHMNRRIYILFAALVSMLMAGCLDYEQQVTLRHDGSGNMVIKYWMKVQDTAAIATIDQISFFNKDSLKKSFASKFIKIKSITAFPDTTTSTYHVEINFDFTHIDSLNKTRPFLESNFSFQDGATNQKIFSQFIPPAASGMAIDATQFHVSFVYRFAGEVITHNATAYDEKTKSYIWKYSLADLGKGKTISVTYRPFKLNETPQWIFYLSGSVFLIVIVFLFRKRKN